MITAIAIAAAAGLLLGGGGMAIVLRNRAPDHAPVVVVPDNTVAEKQIEVVQALTSLDMAKLVCETDDQVACLQVLCWQMTAGTEAAGAECERYGNHWLSAQVYATCSKAADPAGCYTVWRERK